MQIKNYGYERCVCDINALEKSYGIKKGSIGKTHENREILYFRIGSGEKKLLFVGAHHAREYVSSYFLMDQAKMLLFAQKCGLCVCGTDIAQKLKNFSLYFVPMLNADGVEISINGPGQNRNLSNMRLKYPDFSTWKANARGVDLNENYPCLWDKKKTHMAGPASEGFKGFEAASENETKALMNFCFENNFHAAITFHAKGEEILYADENSFGRINGAKTAAKAIANVSSYSIMPPSHDASVYAAGFENWFRDVFERICILIELAPYERGPLPFDMQKYNECVWKKARGIITAFLKIV